MSTAGAPAEGATEPTGGRTGERGVAPARLVLGVIGVAAGLFGVVRLFRLDASGLLDALLWMVGAAVVHDAVVAPLVLLVAWVLRRVLPGRWRTRVTVGLVVVATVTATAVPVLGRFGERPDNPTLLDRPYWVGWLVLVVLVAAVVLLLDPVRRA
ncbi:MAG: hypothetical protein JWR20_39, partial [Marmoricola sp.]|nr:hypothetical protein [Marmoricola sp.]